MNYYLYPVVILIVVLSSATITQAANLTDDRFIIETVGSGFVTATTFSFIEENRFLVGQKNGVIWLVENGVTRPTPVYTIPNINTYWDRGLLGLTVDPQFSQNGYVYVSYTYEHNPADFEGPKTARIDRLTVNQQTMLVTSVTTLVGTVTPTSAQPSCTNFPVGADCIPSDSPSHSAGGLRFGPDGYLYATVGDGAGFTDTDQKALKAQDLDSLSGKVLRINRNGVAPTDNPFYTGNGANNRSKIFAYGIRNSYRFNFEPATGALYAGEVGWYLQEEINLIARGSNLGWPCREGFNLHPLYECVATNYVDPLYVYGHTPVGSGNAVTGGAFAMSPRYGDLQGDYFFGDYSQDFMKRAEVAGRDFAVFDFGTSVGGPVDIQTGPDGLIYYVSIYTGEIRRINTRTENQAPKATMTVGQAIGNAPVTVSFSAVGSSDPDGDTLSYQWTFGDGATGTGLTTNHTYATNGTYTATLVVSDGKGGQTQTSRTVTIGASEFPAVLAVTASTHNPNPLYLGQDVTIETTVSNSGLAASVLAYYEVYNAAGQRVSYHVVPAVTLAGGASQTFSFTTLPPVPGEYTIALGLFSSDWRHMYAWETEVRQIAVLNRIIEQPQLSFVTANGATTGRVGAQMPLTIAVSNNGTRGDGIVYVEFYTVAGVLESTQYVATNFRAAETKNVSLTWSPKQSGAYTMAVGLFDPAWGTMYQWVDEAFVSTIGDETPTVPSFRTVSAVSPATGAVAIALPLTLNVRNFGATGAGIVYVEFYHDGDLASYQYLEVALDSGATESFGFSWTPEVSGTYTVSVGLFDPTWGTVYEWQDAVATIAVQ